MIRALLILLLTSCFMSQVRASHAMGGELTWQYINGAYQFTLVFYRDCNGAEVNTVSETIRVWNHPSLTSITLPFVERIDISPICTPVLSGPPQFACGSGNAAGNGIGAIEKIIYRSTPITINGTPPSKGWVFTFENFSRSSSITNISNPATYGTTIAAKIYPKGGNSAQDNSPQFLQEPYFVACAGSPYQYNMNAIDPDLDSLYIDFGVPYSIFPTGTYNPPLNPIPVPFEPGFNFSSPTPSQNLNPANIPATINHTNGTINFTSYTPGNFVVKASVKSYRQSQLIAEVEREMQLIINTCPANNTAPIIQAPFPGNTFEKTVTVGSLINFQLVSSDLEVLQDGAPQVNLLTASGPMFGTNFISQTGCQTAPCATLDQQPIITGTQGVTANFNWQTTCEHLINPLGNGLITSDFNFVFRVQDNYCSVPKVSYATVSIHLKNTGSTEAPTFGCIQESPSGWKLIWNKVNDPEQAFAGYEVYSVENGLLASLSNITDTTFEHLPPTSIQHYFIVTKSGCNGKLKAYSDTIEPISLNVINPNDGTAILNWNRPDNKNLSSPFEIQQNSGTAWSLAGTTLTTSFIDTIKVCETPMTYRILQAGNGCSYISNGFIEYFSDKITPDIPVIQSVSWDTISSKYVLSWDVNKQSDTYGYVIYQLNTSGQLLPIDTVFGRLNNTYTTSLDPALGPYTFSVAAFDSCKTANSATNYQTSAKAVLHKSIQLSVRLKRCETTCLLSWSNYVGWQPDSIRIWLRTNMGPWINVSTVKGNSTELNILPGNNYQFVVEAFNKLGNTACSNLAELIVPGPLVPKTHYLKYVTVKDEQVYLWHEVDISSGVKKLIVERQQNTEPFEELNTLLIFNNLIGYVDEEVEVDKNNYTYRIRVLDSCGQPSIASNIGKTILLETAVNELSEEVNLTWNTYLGFDGGVIGFELYRSFDGNFPTTPYKTFSATQSSFLDKLTGSGFEGNVCYFIRALEGSNTYNDPASSNSNHACVVFTPLVYLPNALVVGGHNPTFKPVITFEQPNQVQLTIYDRYGQVIFETFDSNEGWSGQLEPSGQLASPGVYPYELRVLDYENREYVTRGHVSVIR